MFKQLLATGIISIVALGSHIAPAAANVWTRHELRFDHNLRDLAHEALHERQTVEHNHASFCDRVRYNPRGASKFLVKEEARYLRVYKTPDYKGVPVAPMRVGDVFYTAYIERIDEQDGSGYTVQHWWGFGTLHTKDAKGQGTEAVGWMEIVEDNPRLEQLVLQYEDDQDDTFYRFY